ncbi:MAG: phosphatidylserine/phosphatidylglycerophosphate/cardiolipin synthase family protein, partial [Methylococcales bacterium]|nr:phosphatidylserine/phosphatidylglycerophosphate/cardiolipin synthase family protein [Methylococcales bacterium]
MQLAEHFAMPRHGNLGGSFSRNTDFNDIFYIRWGKIDFDVFYGTQANIKVILKVYRDNICETYIVDTDPYDIQWNQHKCCTRDFYIHPFSNNFGQINCIKFSFIVHLDEHSIPSEKDYIFMDGLQLQDNDQPQYRAITSEWATGNAYRSYELSQVELQCDVDWFNQHFESLELVPKFTKGQVNHPYHPKRYIHDLIDKVIRCKWDNPDRLCTVKVSVDCIDDADFVTHLITASEQGVLVQCIVDWRKMTLTNSQS